MPSKLLLHFIECRVDQVNKKQMKIAVNSTTQYFETPSQKKMSAKHLKFLVEPPQNGRPVNFCEIEQKPSFNDQYFQTSRI